MPLDHLKIQKYIIQNGWAVIPAKLSVNKDKKKEVQLKSEYWTKDAEKGLDDPALVKDVFKGKNAVGIVTGFRSNITVIDIDVNKKTGKPYTPLSTFPKTYTVKTQSGGYHLYYTYYSEIASKADVGGDLYPKVDCRNDGGFVFAPPTKGYEVVQDVEPQPFPVEFFEKIKTARRVTSKYKGLQNIKNFKGMEEGERDTALFTFAEHAFRTTSMKNWPNVDLVVWSLNREMKTPLPESQVGKILDSARRYSETHEKELELDVDKNGNPQKVLANVIKILETDPKFKGRIRANTFAGSIEYFNESKVWDVITKADETEIRLELSRSYEFARSLPKAHVEDAIAYLAKKNQISPVKEHFEKLVWDEKPRLDKWLYKTYHVDRMSPYYKEMGHHYLVGLVNRIFNPGCQMDNAIVLDGVEGFGKSQSLRTLCDFEELGFLFHETSENPDGKDFAISLLGNIITEFAEGAVFDYKDRKKVKSFISKTHDKYRPPYERSALDFPRQGVFAMSTNDSQYLEDRGINRRWWPIVLDRESDRKANIEWLKENREQLFAEAVAKKDEDFWSFSKKAQEELDLLRDEKKVEDETYTPIYDWYLALNEEKRGDGITKKEGFDVLNIHKDPTDFDLKKIGEFYTEVLHLKPARRRKNYVLRRVFIPTKKTPEFIKELEDELF